MDVRKSLIKWGLWLQSIHKFRLIRFRGELSCQRLDGADPPGRCTSLYVGSEVFVPDHCPIRWGREGAGCLGVG